MELDHIKSKTESQNQLDHCLNSQKYFSILLGQEQEALANVTIKGHP